MAGKSAIDEADDFFEKLLEEAAVPAPVAGAAPSATGPPAAAPTAASPTAAAVPASGAPAASPPPVSTNAQAASTAPTVSASPSANAAPATSATIGGGTPATVVMDIGDIEAEYAQLESKLSTPAATTAPSTVNATPTSSATPSIAPMKFDLMADEDDCPIEEVSYVDAQNTPSFDLRPTQLAEAPADFTQEDKKLRDTLSEFYHGYKAENITNVDNIVKKYRGNGVPTLWAQLSLKYSLPSHESVKWLSRTLYYTSPFEYGDADAVYDLATSFVELNEQKGPNRTEMLRHAWDKGIEEGCDRHLRMLCFRGIPDDSGMRPRLWKMLLGYTPISRHSEWNAIQGEKRALYNTYKYDFLSQPEAGGTVKVRQDTVASPELIQEFTDLLEEIQQDVDRTRRETAFFQKPESTNQLLSLLFVYARLNHGIRYVQGMNEIAAVLLFVMSQEHGSDFVEADTFWCFSELMAEIKDTFIQELDDTSVGIHGQVEQVARLLRSYDFDLARHIQKHDVPPVIFALRWCTMLFAQDATLADLVRLWDAFLSDPRRFDFSSHVCLALVMHNRDEILQTENVMTLMEILQGAPRNADLDEILKTAAAVTAFERRVHAPVFPPLTSGQLMEDFSEWAQSAIEKAKVVSSGVTSQLKQHLSPEMVSQVEEVSNVAAAAVGMGVMSAQVLWEDTAAHRKEALSTARTSLSSLWSMVKATSEQAVEQYAGPDGIAQAQTALNTAAESAAGAAAAAYSRGSVIASQAATQYGSDYGAQDMRRGPYGGNSYGT